MRKQICPLVASILFVCLTGSCAGAPSAADADPAVAAAVPVPLQNATVEPESANLIAPPPQTPAPGEAIPQPAAPQPAAPAPTAPPPGTLHPTVLKPAKAAAQQPPASEVPATETAAPVLDLTRSAPGLQLGGAAPALTETLNQTLKMLSKEQGENERLRQKVSQLEAQLAEKDKTIADLNSQLEGSGSRIGELEAALDQWKSDVLGFRDEMRKAEEAEIEVLQKMLTLLQSFRKEATAE